MEKIENIANQAQRVAPVVENVSDKYVVINSEAMIVELGKRGFALRSIMQSKTGKGMHVIRMQSTTPYVTESGEVLHAELVIKNSYDTRSGFIVQLGVLRQICTNGLTVQDGRSFFKTRHIGSEAQLAEEITLRFTDNLAHVWAAQKRLEAFELTEEQAVDLAMQAAVIRWKKAFTREQARDLLKVARLEDYGRDAWRVLNVLQENILRGGVKLKGMKRMPRPINSPYNHSTMNEKLFSMVYDLVDSQN